MRGKHDDGYCLRFGRDLAQYSQPVEFGHPHVEDYAIWNLEFEAVEEIHAAAKGTANIAEPFEPAHQRLAHTGFVIDDRDAVFSVVIGVRVLRISSQ